MFKHLICNCITLFLYKTWVFISQGPDLLLYYFSEREVKMINFFVLNWPWSQNSMFRRISGFRLYVEHIHSLFNMKICTECSPSNSNWHFSVFKGYILFQIPLQSHQSRRLLYCTFQNDPPGRWLKFFALLTINIQTTEFHLVYRIWIFIQSPFSICKSKCALHLNFTSPEHSVWIQVPLCITFPEFYMTFFWANLTLIILLQLKQPKMQIEMGERVCRDPVPSTIQGSVFSILKEQAVNLCHSLLIWILNYLKPLEWNF